MKKADLHVHSIYSNRPSEWFLQKLGAGESYTDVETIYEGAKARGMDYVTITDHNSIEGARVLNEKYPEDTFISVEATAYFPEDTGKVHILIYDITVEKFNEIQILRKDIYKLRNFIKDNGLAYSVAHATYSVDGTLKSEHIEKLLLLFDVFEIINGGRNEYNNKTWENYLRELTVNDITALYNKHKIEFFSDTPWIKGFTGGSDDHGGLFYAKTYTYCECETKEEFVNSLKNRKSGAYGRHNDYKGLAFTIYKVAYEHAKRKSGNISKGFFSDINSLIFDKRKLSFKDKIKLFKIKKEKNEKRKSVKYHIAELIEEMGTMWEEDSDKKLGIVYEKISDISDEYIALFMDSAVKEIKKGDIYKFIKNVVTSLTGIFLCIPFISTLKHMWYDKELLEKVDKTLGKERESRGARVIWFTDTINDLNGVSVTLGKIAEKSFLSGYDLKIAAAKGDLDERGLDGMGLTIASEFSLPYYEKYKVKIPSILKTIQQFYEYCPDKVYISTPGPVGLLGLAMSKMLKIKCVGVYHTDFAVQARLIAQNASVETMIESYMKWFYSSCDEVKVPTNEYMEILKNRGYKTENITVFKRGIEGEIFRKYDEQSGFLKDRYFIKNGAVFLYTGRVSKDKNIEFMIEAFEKALEYEKKMNFVITGDGPDLEELKKKYKKSDRVIFTGKIEHKRLPELYNSVDYFMFASTTDTFGMSVLEAQSCGVPAIVSDIGGPKEIIINNETGIILPLDKEIWSIKIAEKAKTILNNSEEYKKEVYQSREKAIERYDWGKAIREIVF